MCISGGVVTIEAFESLCGKFKALLQRSCMPPGQQCEAWFAVDSRSICCLLHLSMGMTY